MPERADEARDTSDETRQALLAEAAALWAAGDGDVAPPGDSGRAIGDLAGFLGAYYRLVAADDLASAGPRRAAAVAAWHAALGANRPQGRAAVHVREPGTASLTGGGTVVDIVTDDMPYLVDSVTMELNRHSADVRLIVHPLLNVHRDVTGMAQGTVAANLGAEQPPGSVPESWIHVELGHLTERDTLAADLRRVLDDLRVAMEDQRRMRAAARELVAALTEAGGPEQSEAGELLAWLAAGHFMFLGYREYGLARHGQEPELRPVPGSGLGILRHDGADSFAATPPGGQQGARAARLLVLAKSSTRSTVYRPSYLDYVAVRKFGPDGQPSGEYRFLGLYTQAAFTESITRIPVLRRKLDRMLEAAGLPADSHDGKELIELLEGFPREELFEISVEQLTPIALAVLRLGERKQVRLFLRPDAYGRYMSCLIYLPRDRYTTQVRVRAMEILRRALHGASADYSAMVGNSALARLHVVVHGEPGRPLPAVDPAALQAEIAAAVRSWDEDLAAEAERELGPERAATVLRDCAAGIPEPYKSDTAPAAAVSDLAVVRRLRELSQPFALRLSINQNGRWRLRVFRLSPITLSDVLPQLQHMGLEVVDEHPYEFSGATGPFWIYDFGLHRPGGASVPPGETDAVRAEFEAALTALWNDQTEDDAFNGLVLDAGLNWRQVVLLRAYARYLRQVGVRFSQDYLQRVLRSNPAITRLLVRLFESRFDPSMQPGAAERCDAIAEELRGALDEVESLDHDRILRSYLALVEATLRTNYYQRRPGGQPSGMGGSRPPAPPGSAPGDEERRRIGRAEEAGYPPYLTLKLAPEMVPAVPAPRPKFEIFVYSPRLEAVHLRFGRVARGGLRWSERLEDFRTEVLGLVKAQEVKNSVIVPSGAKGGFVCKRLPAAADREAQAAEVLACYRTFISAMLDITDNIDGERVVPPPDVVRLDGDDPYLVVAADKGTATFSDVANEIADRYGFWLGDAFASGGSEGYDHKKMGITARGAWESVRWHFAALRLNPDTDDFTVAGIGDMSGDVFGNGMLLSEHIKLVAAFDHRHIFLDPNPDPAVSFAERRRLFGLPRSSWADYDPRLISAGGGVWPRSVKSIPLSAQARAALGLDSGTHQLSPDELISAILKAPVDLLWNGGIGTYVKASHETHADVGDRSNDAVRVDATQVRARVVAEGGNLGLTQAARIEYALGGGLINTDFIDNSAGVDTSDHEVNIKILLLAPGGRPPGDPAGSPAGAIPLSRGERAQLLHEMTGEVAAHVLRHNDMQNMALAVARYQAPRMLHVHARYLRRLVRDKRLSLDGDVLPGTKEIAARRSAGTGLTTPELALLLAHTKIAAGQDVLASGLPDDPYLRAALADYFPAPLRARFASRMDAHRLRREIITTSVVNEMVDTGGSTFLFRMGEETGAPVPDITRAWLVAREVFGMPAFWRQVEGTAGEIDVDTRIALVLEARKLMERATRWLLVNRRPPFGIAETVSFLNEGVATVRSAIPKLLSGRDLAGYEERRASFAARGVPAQLADEVAAMVPSYSAFDIVQSAAACGRGVEETAAVYFTVADRLQIGRLRDLIVALPREDRWSSMARSALRDDLYGAHAALTRDVLAVGGDGAAAERFSAWQARNAAAVERAARTLGEIWESERFTFTTLSVATRVIRTLVAPGALPAQEAFA
ncbi:MAG TPA: NAD-glutamate dehydrogenase [Trebonia sp.]|jgi:glutamate dehydrogenase|nr:NAD-glutamate dehydrogenase [Trebonia sp.]